MTAIDLPEFPAHAEAPPRRTGQAMRRGARGRCPACGKGAMYGRYLKVTDHCGSCGEALHHQRADDGPAYITIMIIAHLFGPLLMIVFFVWQPPVAIMLPAFCIGAVAGALMLLPAVKGAMIGMQWARRMHGFDETAPSPHLATSEGP